LLFHQGNTQILIKISSEITCPKTERPSEGFIMFRVDCHCCNDTFDQNKKLAVEISKLMETIIIGSNALDPESLCIITGRYVWKIVVDCVVVNDDGNVIDAILNGAIIGLMDMKKPFVSINKSTVQTYLLRLVCKNKKCRS
jgi:exosome complex component RRP45